MSIKPTKVIRTKVPVQYTNPTTQKDESNIIVTEIIPETYSFGSGIMVKDYAIKNNVRVMIRTRFIEIDTQQTDSLFTSVGNDILHTLSFTTQFLDLLCNAQWVKVQAEPPFLLTALDFEQIDNI